MKKFSIMLGTLFGGCNTTPYAVEEDFFGVADLTPSAVARSVIAPMNRYDTLRASHGTECHDGPRRRDNHISTNLRAGRNMNVWSNHDTRS